MGVHGRIREKKSQVARRTGGINGIILIVELLSESQQVSRRNLYDVLIRHVGLNATLIEGRLEKCASSN